MDFPLRTSWIIPCKALIILNQDKLLRPICDSCVLESTRATRDTYSNINSNNNACHDSDPVTPNMVDFCRPIRAVTPGATTTICGIRYQLRYLYPSS